MIVAKFCGDEGGVLGQNFTHPKSAQSFLCKNLLTPPKKSHTTATIYMQNSTFTRMCSTFSLCHKTSGYCGLMTSHRCPTSDGEDQSLRHRVHMGTMDSSSTGGENFYSRIGDTGETTPIIVHISTALKAAD